jgi:nitrite reductase/ring-hydroxylating ferredoxin subunit
VLYAAIIEPHDSCPELYRVVEVGRTVVAGVYRDARSVVVYVDKCPWLRGSAPSLIVSDRGGIAALS